MQAHSCRTVSAVVALFALMVLSMVALGSTGVPISRFNAFMKQQSPTELGLYDAHDKVVILTNVNFNATVLRQNRSTLVEFYNSFCGHCKRFAPHYKNLALELYPWRDSIKICALDCAAEENNDICREYEVMSYPTLRYFGPDYVISEHNLGQNIQSQKTEEIRVQLAQFLAAENNTEHTNIPNLRSVTASEASNLFEGVNGQVKYVVLVYEPDNTTVGLETILHLQRWPDVQLRRVTDLNIAKQFQIDVTHYKFATVNRSGRVVPYGVLGDKLNDYVDSIQSFLRAQNFSERPDATTSESLNNGNEQHALDGVALESIIEEVQRNHHLVYQADLELGLRKIIFNELSKFSEISGERLLAMQRLLSVLKRYNPLGVRGHEFISRLHQFVMQHNESLSGKDFENEVERLEKELSPVFTSTHYVGCVGSQPNLRGYTCALWQLFHHLTVQAARKDLSQDPLEVLQAMHGYVKHYFGCTNCSQHFQEMAARRKIWNVPNKDEAVLWLWEAHNEVNKRLAGDYTEDPKFPKIQFPSPRSCAQCYKNPTASPANLENNWNKDAVLSFLKNIHNPEYVSRFGVTDNESDKLRRKRMISNVFTEMDMRMGMLLYGFCIVMMVVAFKLFACKGYRKKPYGHDMLGKV